MGSIRECFPIDNFEDLISWESVDCLINVSLIKDLSNHHYNYLNGSKVIVCHDMKGGYLEDRFIDGDDNYQAYRFFHWSLIDTFIYFSHRFITIPPLTWINAAHTNGVSILGTIITEGKIGGEICSSLLQSKEMIELVCTKLVEIASHFKFEGWFINIENVIDKVQVPKLIHFIRTLQSAIKKAIPKGQVLWYDSVTSDGKLDWQNCLNHKNMTFFQSCDGIFLNYTWTEHNLRYSSDLATSLDRRNDVFVGIDVFGRGMIGGGGFNTHLALDKIREHLLPVAIFAPGWVLEKLGPEEFTQNQIKFWNELSLQTRHFPSEIPFSSNFCQGFGLNRYANGRKISDKPWYNLSLVQPTTRNYVDGEIFLEDAFEGGQSIHIINWDEPLLECYFSVQTELQIQLIFKLFDSVEKLSYIAIEVDFEYSGPRVRSFMGQYLSRQEIGCSEPPSKLDNSGWNCVRFKVPPLKTPVVLTSIRIKKTDLFNELTFLLGALKVDYSIGSQLNNPESESNSSKNT